MKEEIGKRVTKIRGGMKMTKEEFAKMLEMSGQHLGAIEKGKNALTCDKLKMLCEKTGVTSDYVLFGKEENIVENTRNTLKNFSDEKIQSACKAIEKIAMFIRA